MTADLAELYQQVILDHNPAKRPRDGRRAQRRGKQPVCGDRVTVHLRVEGDVVRDASFQASRCAIVKASASLMTESIKARTVADARALAERFRR